MRNGRDDDPEEKPSPEAKYKNSDEYSLSKILPLRNSRQEDQSADGQNVQNSSNSVISPDASHASQMNPNSSPNAIEQVQIESNHGLTEQIQIDHDDRQIDISEIFETLQLNNDNEAHIEGLRALTASVTQQFDALRQNNDTYLNQIHRTVAQGRDEIVEINNRLGNNVGFFNWFGWNLTTLFAGLGILCLGVGSYFVWRHLNVQNEMIRNDIVGLQSLLESFGRRLESSRAEVIKAQTDLQNLQNSRNRTFFEMFGWAFGGFALGGRAFFRFLKRWFS